MALVRKKNRILRVNDNSVDVYLKRGYDQIDESGKIIKGATGGKTVSIAEFNALKTENEELKKEIASLKGQITKLKNAEKNKK